MTTPIRFPDPNPRRGPELEQLDARMDSLQSEPPLGMWAEWSSGSESPHAHYFSPLDVSHADALVTERLARPQRTMLRALDERIAGLRDVAATTWPERRLRQAGYAWNGSEWRREARRRKALAAELRDLRRLRRQA